MPLWRSRSAQCYVLAASVALTPLSAALAQHKSLGQLFTALDRPVLFPRGINKWPLERVLDQLRQKNNLEFEIDANAFEKKLDRRDIAKSAVSFDPVSGIPTSLFLDMLLRQLDAHFETRDGKVRIVPMTERHSLYHPACLPSVDERGTRLVESKLRRPVSLKNGLERMTFGEAKNYFEDRYDVSILVDQGLFPKESKAITRRLTELPVLDKVALGTVLNSLLLQIDAAMEIRGGAILIVPKALEKRPSPALHSGAILK